MSPENNDVQGRNASGINKQHSLPPDTAAVFPCDQCGRSCLCKIELFNHTRWHTMQKKQRGRIRRTDGQTDDDDFFTEVTS